MMIRFHCTAHQVPEARRKALFLTRIGRDTLKILVSPTLLNNVPLTAIVTVMTQHFNKDTWERATLSEFNLRKKWCPIM